MTTYLFTGSTEVFLVQTSSEFALNREQAKLEWMLEAKLVDGGSVTGCFVGPRSEMVSPWSTNAVDIARNLGIQGVKRIERYENASPGAPHDKMLEREYSTLTSTTLEISKTAEPGFPVTNLAEFNRKEGLALSEDEIEYLERSSEELRRALTDTEVYAFAQINSEHCRHKIFRGQFVIDGKRQPFSLFQFIKKTSEFAPRNIVSAYSDNVAFLRGCEVAEFAATVPEKPSFFGFTPARVNFSLKAETHNFPTTVEPFFGASTGSGGEIRDRMAGGRGSIPLAGAAVYMTAYPRIEGSRAKEWEQHTQERKWKYQTPEQILLKASNGASDFGNKFGQPLLCGSLFTFEAQTGQGLIGFDRCVMLAGGVGYGHAHAATKSPVQAGDKVVLLGGDNYRIGMAGGSVSSVTTGKYGSEIELSAVQRANPEMQKRVYNVIRALAEREDNPIKTIHDHGAGGHVNCFSELLESEGGVIYVDALPVGDPTLSYRELLCNESQERMGLIVAPEAIGLLSELAEREHAPMYVVGEITGKKRIEFVAQDGSKPLDVTPEFLFGNSPKTTLEDETRILTEPSVKPTIASSEELLNAIRDVLSLEGVACKDWLTNKVDRCVTGKIAQQQCVGPLHLPLCDYSISTFDHSSHHGVAMAIGHAPAPGLISEAAGSVLSIAEALTNIVFAPLERGLDSIALSANWMWPVGQKGESARLYRAVEACSSFATEIGIAIPTGKDSLSMTMRYENGVEVKAPGTVVITASGVVSDFRLRVTPDLKPGKSRLLYVNLSGIDANPLGGSSYAQTLGKIGQECPTVEDPKLFKRGFNALQELMKEKRILAGHDVSAGGLVTTLLEMAFGGDIGISVVLHDESATPANVLFCEKPGVVLQVLESEVDNVMKYFIGRGLASANIGSVGGEDISIRVGALTVKAPVKELLDTWYRPSYLLDTRQTKPELAKERFESVRKRALNYKFPNTFTGRAEDYGIDLKRSGTTGLVAAVVREQGTNGEREMAYALHSVGFDVRDVTMSDLVSGRETLSEAKFLVFPGGFANSDVLGAGRGWAGVFRYNDKAMKALQGFVKRDDTLLLGVCNGCQLVTALELLYPEHSNKIAMRRNVSHKFESGFINVDVPETNSILLKPLIGSRLGIWVAHGEGNFSLPEGEKAYDIAMRYSTPLYPGNPNGAQYNAAGVCSKDGRHLVMMPHLERSALPHHWAYYPHERREADSITPWMLAFAAARDWIKAR